MKRKYVNHMVKNQNWKDTVRDRNRRILVILGIVFVLGIGLGVALTMLFT